MDRSLQNAAGMAWRWSWLLGLVLASGCSQAEWEELGPPEFRACGEIDAECDGGLAEEEQCFLEAVESCVPATLGYAFVEDPEATSTILEYRELRVVPTPSGCKIERSDWTRQPGDDGSGSATSSCAGAREGGPETCRSVWAFGC